MLLKEHEKWLFCLIWQLSKPKNRKNKIIFICQITLKEELSTVVIPVALPFMRANQFIPVQEDEVPVIREEFMEAADLEIIKPEVMGGLMAEPTLPKVEPNVPGVMTSGGSKSPLTKVFG